jgi:hypothetical protein
MITLKDRENSLTYYLKLSAQTIQGKNASKMFETKNSIYLPNMSDFGILDEDCSRNVSCTLNLISTLFGFFLQNDHLYGSLMGNKHSFLFCFEKGSRRGPNSKI